jgi:hypothetical protein
LPWARLRRIQSLPLGELRFGPLRIFRMDRAAAIRRPTAVYRSNRY